MGPQCTRKLAGIAPLTARCITAIDRMLVVWGHEGAWAATITAIAHTMLSKHAHTMMSKHAHTMLPKRAHTKHAHGSWTPTACWT